MGLSSSAQHQRSTGSRTVNRSRSHSNIRTLAGQFQAGWPARRLSPQTLKQDTHYLRILLGKLRAHLGDGAANPRYIATESGVGLRFIGTMPELAKTILVESRAVP